jgi:hypothetical protein
VGSDLNTKEFDEEEDAMMWLADNLRNVRLSRLLNILKVLITGIKMIRLDFLSMNLWV